VNVDYEEQYLDIGKRSVLEVIAGEQLDAIAPRFLDGVIASLVIFPAKVGNEATLPNVMSKSPTFALRNPTLDTTRSVGVALNRQQAIELACTLLNVAGVVYDLDDFDDPTDDEFASYATH
jgi:hypothetical protein